MTQNEFNLSASLPVVLPGILYCSTEFNAFNGGGATASVLILFQDCCQLYTYCKYLLDLSYRSINRPFNSIGDESQIIITE